MISAKTLHIAHAWLLAVPAFLGLLARRPARRPALTVDDVNARIPNALSAANRLAPKLDGRLSSYAGPTLGGGSV